jgi:hypothetical protein
MYTYEVGIRAVFQAVIIFILNSCGIDFTLLATQTYKPDLERDALTYSFPYSQQFYIH